VSGSSPAWKTRCAEVDKKEQRDRAEQTFAALLGPNRRHFGHHSWSHTAPAAAPGNHLARIAFPLRPPQEKNKDDGSLPIMFALVAAAAGVIMFGMT
jgi:hypothetical protein